MTTRAKRCASYLDAYNFYPNSIAFRICSSRALERWKNVQSFQLGQLVNGKYFFSKDRREILLLKYDLWSRWLYEIENLCIASASMGIQTATQDHVDTMIALSEKTTSTYKHLMTNQEKANFDEQFVKIWLEVHELPYKYLIEEITESVGLDFETLFTKLTTALVAVMQHTLIEIHELDMLLCKNDDCLTSISATLSNEPHFVIITGFVYQVFASLGQCLICNRLRVYRKYTDLNSVYIKNYTDRPIRPKLIENIENLGITIDFRKSLIGV